MPHRYSTAFSHIVLAGTGIYCLVQSKGMSNHLIHVAFGTITVNSLVGVWRWGNPDYGDDADSVYRFTSYVQLLFALPTVTTYLWLSYGYEPYFSYAFTVLPLIPFIFYLADSSESKLEELVIPVGLIGLGVASFLGENYWGIAATLSYAIDHYIVLKQGDSLENIPAQDLYNYGLCFFAYFALLALSG